MIINIKDVKVEKKDSNTRRARKAFGDLIGLAASIKKHGLLHPIVVVSVFDEPENGQDWRLVAGERRLRACMLNGDSLIEAKLLVDLGEAERKEIELEENILRKKLDWPEECEAVRQLDALKRKIYGGATTSPTGDKEKWQLKDTAEMLGMSLGSVHGAIKLAKQIKKHPKLLRKVQKLPKQAARKVIDRELASEEMKRRVKNQEITISSDLRLGDACDLIDAIYDNSIHLLLTDPPFAVQDIIDVGSSGSMTYNVTAKTNVSEEDVMRDVYQILLPKVFKKMVPGAHIYIFFGFAWYHELIMLLRKIGFVVDDLPIIWNKRRPSMIPKDLHYVSCYEAVLFGYKPPPIRILRKPVNNVIDCPAIAPQLRVHGLQKPFDLLKIFIENSSNMGEVVLDCFAGSASTLVAAKKLQRSAIGFEIDENNFYKAQEFMLKELKHE